MTATLTVVLLLIGACGGYYVGRLRAEIGRAMADGRGAWKRRHDYRN